LFEKTKQIWRFTNSRHQWVEELKDEKRDKELKLSFLLLDYWRLHGSSYEFGSARPRLERGGERKRKDTEKVKWRERERKEKRE